MVMEINNTDVNEKKNTNTHTHTHKHSGIWQEYPLSSGTSASVDRSGSPSFDCAWNFHPLELPYDTSLIYISRSLIFEPCAPEKSHGSLLLVHQARHHSLAKLTFDCFLMFAWTGEPTPGSLSFSFFFSHYDPVYTARIRRAFCASVNFICVHAKFSAIWAVLYAIHPRKNTI